MRGHDQKALTIRTEEIATVKKAAEQIRAGNVGGAYSYLFNAANEIHKIEYDLVKELGAIEERSR